ncbi:nucleotidyltransferase domain-containing protein [Rossellomorea sp. LJF3]|uniref:nucleotidyltransferase domain-containing protein n=1 Tax=Rossellomorea sp. LJF3 TaxID=3126099 RepID=UPI00300BFCA1
MIRPSPIEAAKLFIHEQFPTCQAALLGGSVVRGEETPTSDLDIVVIDEHLKTEYRESLISHGWPIEVFVHNLKTLRHYFQSDSNRARPSIQKMVSEGIPLTGHPVIDSIKLEANKMLRDGPPEWSTETIRTKRYFLTDALDDLIGSTNRGESIFIANSIGELLHEFVLRTNRHWIGSSKWIVRALHEYDPQFAKEFVNAFEHFYRKNDKMEIVRLVDSVPQKHGGRLFEGFSVGKR